LCDGFAAAADHLPIFINQAKLAQVVHVQVPLEVRVQDAAGMHREGADAVVQAAFIQR